MDSITRQLYHYRDIKGDWILREPVMEGPWSQCLQTLELSGYGVLSIAWDRNGIRLASVAQNGVGIWNPITSGCNLILCDSQFTKSSIW